MVLPEIVAVGIYNSQTAVKNTTISKERKTSVFEIELPIEDGGISYIDSESKKIIPNMLICAKPGQMRHSKFPYKCYYVHITVQSESLYNILINTPSFFEIDKTDVYNKIFTRLMKHYHTFDENEEIILQSIILELIYIINRDSRKAIKINDSVNHHIIIDKALRYIKDHLTEDLNLNRIADAVSLSPVHFHNTFKKSIGKTLHDYIEEQRIKKAIHLLVSTDYSLTKIAFECGFSSQSYFSYVFKRRMKMTPREYVKEIYNRYEI